MYSYVFDKKTHGYKLTTQTGKFVASEIRPIFAEELLLLHGERFFRFNYDEKRPLLWGKHNLYFYDGEEIAKAQVNADGILELVLSGENIPKSIEPSNIELMVKRNKKIMDSLVSNTLKREPISKVLDFDC